MRRLLLPVLLLAALVLAGQVAAAEAGAADGERVIMGEGVLDFFRRGGILMWPILACSIVALAFTFERIFALRTTAVFPRRLHEDVRSLITQGRVAEAMQACEENQSAFARLLHACLRRSDGDGFEMEIALEEAGSRVLYDLRRNGQPLGVIADVSPLLGLMGTVLGMIKAFEVVARTGALGRAEMLAEGIGEALLTTAFGLSVAIPALILFQYFRGRAEDLVRAMEDASIVIMSDVRKHRKP